MIIDNIPVEQTLESVRRQLDEEKNLSPALRASLELLLTLTTLLLNRLGLNSRNSSKPPSTDPNRKKAGKNGNNNTPGAQKGHTGHHLELVDDPDHVEWLPVDRATLPTDGIFRCIGYERRQVFDIHISRVVTEYRAEILADAREQRVVAPFPDHVKVKTQYAAGVKIHSVYMSLFQLLPYQRIEEHFADQFGLPLSAGSLYNFNKEVYEMLAPFEDWAKRELSRALLLHADETGINIGGKRKWLHVLCSATLTLLMPHDKRGGEAIAAMGVLPGYTGTLVHDHWKPYYQLLCYHALCNAHHLRELERAWEQDQQQWAKQVQELLLEINKAVDEAGGVLNSTQAEAFRERYRQLLKAGQIECPPPDESQRKSGQRGRLKRSKSRNLLERLIQFETDVLRFMVERDVPFTNNQGERDLRMSKVQQKISGCFRSELGARIFARIRSYLSTCQKNGVSSEQALRLLYEGRWPDFMGMTPE
ncbi:IS66 family transposase [Magnetovirga frankeli]|uniref:IS66 family transposase n=1 Tax=Magnetovirga frankeli TaxID=947516 RepID=UPI0012932156|nr:IS66 family transposase [gamma proteobacterium SS-5]QFY90503.1 IS66 family transposase [gamma proteobacterium SS-5]QFY90555.1 IS66 family transposase [gamma proteobacterium SS-5]QFY90640.1 IS66 family transposase [gamma proteobacterium SS-5]